MNALRREICARGLDDRIGFALFGIMASLSIPDQKAPIADAGSREQ
jgi:hypothetical protein